MIKKGTCSLISRLSQMERVREYQMREMKELLKRWITQVKSKKKE